MPQEQLEYGVHQTERCPTTGREHVQFMVVFPERRRLGQLKKMFPGDHLEPAKHPRLARDYCMKEETRVTPPVEVGSVGTWGKEVRKLNVIEALSTKRVRDVLNEYPDLWRSVRQLRDLRSELQPTRRSLSLGILFHGKTGTGKTRSSQLISSFLGDDCYWKPTGKWWNNYDQERVVFYDEFRGDLTPGEVLRLLDRTPHQVEYKGGVTNFVSPWVIFCSNLSLEHMYYSVDKRSLDAIRRRFICIEFL